MRNSISCLAIACLCLLPATDAVAQGNLRLILEADRASYWLGEPLVVSVELRNSGTTTVEVAKHLRPEYQFTRYTIVGPGGRRIVFQPVTTRNVRHRYRGMLEPGGSIFASAKLFFGNKGWVFDRAGKYRITAVHTALEGESIASDPLDVEIKKPPAAHRATAKAMLTGEVGLFLLWEGGDQFEEGISVLQGVTQGAPRSVYAAYANHALGMNLAQDQGPRKADLPAARRYLEKAESLSRERAATDYVRSTTLEKLADLYGEAGQADDRERIIQLYRREFGAHTRYLSQLRRMESPGDG